MTSNWRNRTTKSRQDQNARRKRDLQILRNLGGWYNQTSGNEKQNLTKNISGKLLETKLSSRNLMKGINTWAVSLVRYSGPFLKWTRDELWQMDQRTRKLMTMHKALHPRDDVVRLYVPRKEGRKGLASIEESIDISIQRLEDYIEKHERGLVTAIRNNTDNMIDNRMTKMGRKTTW